MEPSFVSANKTHRPRASGAKADKKEAYQKKKKGIDGEKHKNAKVSYLCIPGAGISVHSEETSRTNTILYIPGRKGSDPILSTVGSILTYPLYPSFLSLSLFLSAYL